MVRKINWETQIGRRLKLRDLHVFVTTVQRGSMAKAAAELRVSQPAVSEVISDLEHTLGVRLLDRSPQGVEPTTYGRALLKRATIVFDELKQGIRDIEFLADPTIGELRIGCSESFALAILPPVIERFSQQYPGVVLYIKDVVSPSLELPDLRERRLDLCLVRLPGPLAEKHDDLNVDILFDDHLVVTVGTQSRWAHRRKVDLAELVNEPWILTPANSRGYMTVAEAFRARRLDMPKISLITFSASLRASLLATGRYLTIFPNSVVQLTADQFSLKALPIDLPVSPWPLAIITLKNRTLSPVVQRFIDHLRAFASSVAAGQTSEKKSA